MVQSRHSETATDAPITLATLNVRTGPRPPRRQREWICYHNPEEMEYSADEADPHSAETGKKRLNPRNMLGDRIWLVGRDEETGRYYLHGFFVVDSFTDWRQLANRKGQRKWSSPRRRSHGIGWES